MLKVDFDQYQNRTQAAQKDQTVTSLIDVVKKFLPFMDGLEKSLATVGESQDNPLVKGVQMTYNNFMKVLEGLAITPVESVGLSPDSSLHEPIGVMPVDDESKKGVIVHEIQKGFVYKKNDVTKVVQSAKVMIGQ